MTTINKVIEYVDGVKPNTFDEEQKFRWICDLDGMVKRLVFQDREGVSYQYPDDLDTQLLIPPPFENIYALYMEAQIDFHNREYAAYNNSAVMFDSQFEEYKKAYIRDNMPKGAGTFKNI